MLNEEIRSKLSQLNEELKDKASETADRALIRSELEKVGSFYNVNRMQPQDIKAFSRGQGMVGVDGSYVVYGNTFPNQIFISQALAKCTKNEKDKSLLTFVETGNTFAEIDSKNPSEEFRKECSRQVTKMEVSVAFNALVKHEPFITLFDGGFWRLSKDAPVEWENFKKETLERQTPCVGIIEDIGSFDLYKTINKEGKHDLSFTLDSDILFGLLEEGEVFIPNELYLNEFVRAFARFSKDPHPIACDFLPEHRNLVMPLLSFIYSMTPVEGRGVPLWIDIVDKEVKVTEDAVQLLVEMQIDPVFRERYFVGKRNNRTV